MNKLVKSKCDAKSVLEFTTFDCLSQTLACKASYLILDTQELMKDESLKTNEKENERYALNVQKMIKAHIQLVMFLMSMELIQKQKFKDEKCAPVLLLCVKIFAIKQLMSDTTPLYECGYFGDGSQQLLEDSMHFLLNQLRPHMIPLVECYGVDGQDWNVLGNKYGDIYELQLDTAKKARINKTPVPAFYHKYMKPTMTMYPAKL